MLLFVCFLLLFLIVTFVYPYRQIPEIGLKFMLISGSFLVGGSFVLLGLVLSSSPPTPSLCHDNQIASCTIGVCVFLLESSIACYCKSGNFHVNAIKFSMPL